MKTNRLILLAFILFTAFACSKKNSKKANESDTIQSKATVEKQFEKEQLKPEVNETKPPCDSIVKELLMSSKRYTQLTKRLNKAVLKNGGQSFELSLEGSPNTHRSKSKIHSKTYDFTVYEVYSERQLNAARFTFNPNNNQLYEYDSVNDTLIPIEFDRNLLMNFESICK